MDDLVYALHLEIILLLSSLVVCNGLFVRLAHLFHSTFLLLLDLFSLQDLALYVLLQLYLPLRELIQVRYVLYLYFYALTSLLLPVIMLILFALVPYLYQTSYQIPPTLLLNLVFPELLLL